MARCLVAGGMQVRGYDIRADNITAAQADPAPDIASVVEASGGVLLSLPDSTAVEAVVYGPDGLLSHARAGQIVVDLSTASPESTRRIYGDLAARGAHYLDAGISGGAAAAENGELTLMVGGESEALERIRGVLGLFSAHIFHCGESGTGHVTKLLNNFLNAVSLAATAEVMVAGKKAGLDLQTLLDVINLSSGVNFATMSRFPKIIHGDYLKGGLSNTLMLKDVTLYAELLGQLGVPSMNAAGPTASFGLARALGYAEEISNTVVDAIGDIAGGVRLHTSAHKEGDNR
jgi:3-hydroxyisobutyrate dehydrogenase-like beta-hydroxyacid dehydrogenase